jgi:RNA polymerase sigma-70 factor (ECF subfamily)
LNTEEFLTRDQHAGAVRRHVLSLFDDDPEARDIVEGTMEGLSPGELRELTGLDKTAYASKRRLIRRRIENAYPEGWKS